MYVCMNLFSLNLLPCIVVCCLSLFWWYIFFFITFDIWLNKFADIFADLVLIKIKFDLHFDFIRNETGLVADCCCCWTLATWVQTSTFYFFWRQNAEVFYDFFTFFERHFSLECLEQALKPVLLYLKRNRKEWCHKFELEKEIRKGLAWTWTYSARVTHF